MAGAPRGARLSVAAVPSTRRGFVCQQTSKQTSQQAGFQSGLPATLLTCLSANELAGLEAFDSKGTAVARTIAVCTQKGGVGKTTTVANLAAAWGSQGRRVLAVDFDPQFALTRRFGIDPSERSTIVDVLEGMILKAKTAPDVGDVVVGEATPLVDVVPAHRRLADVETSLVREIKRETFLRRALRGHIDPYDIVLIDCPPNLGLLTVNALCAADEAVVPIDMKSVDALAGAEELIATAEALEEDGPSSDRPGTQPRRGKPEPPAPGLRRHRRSARRSSTFRSLARSFQPGTISRKPRSCRSRLSCGVLTTSARWRSSLSLTSSTRSQHEPA